MIERSAARRIRGFTLIEVLVALTILAILLTTVYGAVSRTIRSKDHAEASGKMNSEGREAAMHIADEIEASLSPSRVVGGVYSPVFQGVGSGSGQPLDEVRFTMTMRPPFGRADGSGSSGGRVAVTYQLGQSQPMQCQPSYMLWRTQIPIQQLAGGQDDQNTDQEIPATQLPVIDHIAGLRLRYLDGNSGQWTDSWDSVTNEDQQGRLPLAVEVALFLYDETCMPNEFSTIVDLPLSTRPTPTPGT